MSSTFLTDANGNPYQFFLNLPFGETMAEQLPSSLYISPYKFNGKELDQETGLYYYGARYYDPKSSIWLSVDPLAEETPDWSPYAFCNNNPLYFIDPTGMSAESIGVTKNEDGTYTTISGNANDGDRGIYVADKNGIYDPKTSEKVGNTKTTHSFFDNNGRIVDGAILDPKSRAGQNFVDGVMEDNPSLVNYMWNARNGRDYDFKDVDIDKRGSLTPSQYRYRGSVDENEDFGSARDFGNYTAGMVAARSGLSWAQARYGFDTYQGFLKMV